jgi:hypothetical protein
MQIIPNKVITMTEPKIESVAGYATNKAPAAARFGVGTSTREGAAQAADARRQHSAELSSRKSTPSSK